MGKLQAKKVNARPNKKSLGISYRGVDVSAHQLSNGKWAYKYRARISAKLQGDTRYLGTFQTPEEAAKAYNLAAKKVFRTETIAKKNHCWNSL